VLPRVNRLVSAEDLRVTQRKGRRLASEFFIIAYRPTSAQDLSRWGFVVSKKVGNAVNRNRVKRRLRALAAQTLSQDSHGSDAVVRALPAARTAKYAELAQAWGLALEGIKR
jgi:ribonuclease P protein component